MNMTEMQVDSDGQVQRPCKGAEDEQTSAAIGEEQHGRAEADSRSPPFQCARMSGSGMSRSGACCSATGRAEHRDGRRAEEGVAADPRRREQPAGGEEDGGDGSAIAEAAATAGWAGGRGSVRNARTDAQTTRG